MLGESGYDYALNRHKRSKMVEPVSTCFCEVCSVTGAALVEARRWHFGLTLFELQEKGSLGLDWLDIILLEVSRAALGIRFSLCSEFGIDL